MNNYTIEGNKLIYSVDKFIAFNFPIKQIAMFNGITLVVLHQFGDAIYNQNIFAANLNGEILWQIEKSEEFDLIGNCPFADLQIIKNEIIVHNWCGFTCKVDSLTGKITEQQFTK